SFLRCRSRKGNEKDQAPGCEPRGFLFAAKDLRGVITMMRLAESRRRPAAVQCAEELRHCAYKENGPPRGGPGRAVWVERCWVLLEGELRADLPPAGKLLARGLAKIRIQVSKVHIEVRQVCAIKEVEKLESDLEVEFFGNARVVIEGGIRLGKVRPAELPRFFIACHVVCRRGSELRGGIREYSLEERALRCGFGVGRDVWIVEVVSIRVEIATARGIASIGAVWRKGCVGVRSVRQSALVDAGSAERPSFGDPADDTLSVVHSGQLVIEGEGEAVRDVPGRRAVILVGRQVIWINARVVVGTRVGIGRIEEGALEAPPYVEDHGVVIRFAIVGTVIDCAEAGIQARGNLARKRGDQIAGLRVDVRPVAD